MKEFLKRVIEKVKELAVLKIAIGVITIAICVLYFCWSYCKDLLQGDYRIIRIAEISDVDNEFEFSGWLLFGIVVFMISLPWVVYIFREKLFRRKIKDVNDIRMTLETWLERGDEGRSIEAGYHDTFSGLGKELNISTKDIKLYLPLQAMKKR